MEKPFVKLHQIIDEFHLNLFYAPAGCLESHVTSMDVYRPGLQLVGFYDHFDAGSIQVLGKVEWAFLQGLDSHQRERVFELLFEKKIPLLIFARDYQPSPECLAMAEKYGVPVAGSGEYTTDLMAAMTSSLHVHLGPTTTLHGVLVEVYGEGILLLGGSGIGKSETAIELIKRGHRLVADDAVEIKRLPDGRLQGTAPESIRHFIEIRGIGVLDVRRLFGMSAVKLYENILLVVQLENWDSKKKYDRLGLEDKTIDILEVPVPAITVPVRPGRNLSTIVEVAAMNARMKMMGYNSARELERRILESIQAGSPALVEEMRRSDAL